MANWNLSVDLRGEGNDLARALRDSARDARGLATAVRTARTQVRGLDTDASAAATQITRLGGASNTAQRNLLRMARQARLSARQLREVARAADQADARLRAMTNDVRISARLDDDTGAGQTAVRTAVDDLNRLSPVRISARLDDDTGAGQATVRAAIADLNRLGPVRIGVHFDADAAQLAAASAAVTAALNAVQGQSSDTSRTLLILAARARRTARELDELADRATLAAGRLTLLNTAAANANGNMLTLAGSVRLLRGNMDDLDGSITRVNTNLNGLNSNLPNAGSNANSAAGNMRTLFMAAGLLATSLIPIAAAAVPIAVGLAAAGAAAGAFGVAIGGQIAALLEAGEAQEKYDTAVREHGKSSEQAVTAETEYLRLLEEMPPATREAAAAVSVLKDEYKAYSDALAADTMPVAIKSMGLLQAILPKTTSLARGASAEFEHMLDVLAGATQTEAFDEMNDKFTEFATSTLAKATSGAVKFATAMDTGEIGSDWRQFLDYAAQNAPLVGDTLRELARAALHLLVAFSDVGVGVLQVVNALASGFADLVNAVPPGALTAFLQVAAVMKLVTLSAAALGVATGGAAAGRLAAYFAVMRAAGVGTTLRATAASMSATAKAAVGLGVLAAAAIGIGMLAEKARGAPPDVDRLTTSLKELSETGKFTGELKKTFGDINGVVEKLGELGKAAKEQEEYVESFGNSGIEVLDDLRRGAHGLWSDFSDGDKSLKALEEDFKGLDEAMAGMVSSGYGDQAANDFDLIKAAALKAGYSIDDINKVLPKYNDALAAFAVEQQLAAAGMGLFGQQAIDVKGKLDAQRASADGLRGAIQALNDVNRQALGGMIGFEASIDAAAKAATDNAGALNMVNGELDLNSTEAQAAATALQDLGAKTDEAAATARASGKPWQEVNAIYARGREELIKSAQAMGLTAGQANILAERILGIPKDHSTHIEMIREDAIAGLDQVIAKIEATPGQKSVTVDALTSEAMSLLNSLGYKTETLPDGRVRVTANTGAALSGLYAVKNARDSLSDKTITITTNYVVTGSQARRPGAHGTQLGNADGSVTDYFAKGGIRGEVKHFANGAENHVAQIAPAGAWRVWAEEETGGEAYVPLAASKRPRSRAIVEETVRRLGGDPAAIQWNAAGNVTDWRYDPNTGSLYSPTDAGAAGRKTKKVKGKDVAYFDLGAVESKVKSLGRATQAWNRDLEKVADRAGGDVAQALASMGDEGVALAKKMANGSNKYVNEMAAALRKLAQEARASLTDYTRQLNNTNKLDSNFAKNLAVLAARGHGDLAAHLAAQNDSAAQQLAEAAVKDNKKAGSANKAAKTASNQLTSDEVQSLVSIIAAIKSSRTGLHAVADTTGIGEDEIVAIATKARSQISSSLGGRAEKFLADLARAQKGLSYANGGIRTGFYATRGGAVTFAEPSTGGEAFIPLGANKRRHAVPVLREAARRMGVGLTDVSSSRQVVIVKEGDTTTINVPAVRTDASASDIGAQVGRSYRRATRGGVKARA